MLEIIIFIWLRINRIFKDLVKEESQLDIQGTIN